jgi:predicted acylesterase/phospholipase RssA
MKTDDSYKELYIKSCKILEPDDCIDNKTNYDTLVLSGGGVRGFIILGGLQYVFEKGYIKNIRNIIGTSVGVILGYLLAIGYTPIEIHVYLSTHNHIFEKLERFNIVDMINGLGALSFLYISDMLEKMTIDKIGRLLTLLELKNDFGIKLISVTYNETKNKTEYISYENSPSIQCITAIRMSSNIPEFFESFIYQGNQYIDGGISDNFPIQEGEKEGKNVLGIMLYQDCVISKNENFIERLYRRMFISYYYLIDYKIALTTRKSTIIKLHDNIKAFNVDANSRNYMFSSGYKNTKIHFEDMLNESINEVRIEEEVFN